MTTMGRKKKLRTRLKPTSTGGKKFSWSPPCRSPPVAIFLQRGSISIREERGDRFGFMGLALWLWLLILFNVIGEVFQWLGLLGPMGLAGDWGHWACCDQWVSPVIGFSGLWLKVVLGGFRRWFYLLWSVMIGRGVVEGGSLIVVAMEVGWERQREHRRGR